MENSKNEVVAVAKVVARENATAVRELAELELAVVGGGCGETIL
jgi:hypothetical protein